MENETVTYHISTWAYTHTYLKKTLIPNERHNHTSIQVGLCWHNYGHTVVSQCVYVSTYTSRPYLSALTTKPILVSKCVGIILKLYKVSLQLITSNDTIIIGWQPVSFKQGWQFAMAESILPGRWNNWQKPWKNFQTAVNGTITNSLKK